MADGRNYMTDRDKPRWAHRSDKLDYKPDWQDHIPRPLHELGEVFFPIPSGRKGWNYPHGSDDYRYSATDEVLNAYFESGWSYGIACAGDLAVVDIDEMDYVDEIVDLLPETVWQMSGSREGYHLFYMVPGLDSRKNLYVWQCSDCNHEFTEWDGEYDEENNEDNRSCPACGLHYDKAHGKKHLGEVKCDPHGYVVGPGSLHPSGNHYGPLHGEEITTVEKDELMDVIGKYHITDEKVAKSLKKGDVDYDSSTDEVHEFYRLDASDVLPWLGADEKIAHPVHGSSTGNNFQMNEGRETFVCWRCQIGVADGAVLSAQHFLAEEGLAEMGSTGDLLCEHVRKRWQDDTRLHFYAWLRAYRLGLVSIEPLPYAVLHGYGRHKELVDADEKIEGKLYFDIKSGFLYELGTDNMPF